MSQYIKEYGILTAPLRGLTKKARAFPKPWIKGEDYDLSFNSLRSAILDSTNFLHHKDCTARLFIEVDASDAGWGACAYQMVEPWTGDPAEEGRGRQGDTGARKQSHPVDQQGMDGVRTEASCLLQRIAGETVGSGEVQKTH
jgi:hypothetical protein